jgi:hypothetical protein
MIFVVFGNAFSQAKLQADLKGSGAEHQKAQAHGI